MGFPEKLHVDGAGRLWVADTGNRRVLQFDTPLSVGTAQRVFGQSNRSQVPTFTTNTLDAPDGFPNASGFAGPRGLLVDGGGRLWVADRDNSRVLGFDAPLHALGDTAAAKAAVVADRILGETSFTDSAVNRASAQRVNNPFALAVDRSASPNRLWVVDIGNNRVLGYASTADLVSDRAADLVLGQPGFTDSDTNAGINGPLQNAATAVASASSLFFPSGVAVDSLGGVYVADASNSRILHFLDPFTTNRTADRVFGQVSFTARNPDYPYGTARSLAGSRAVDVDETDALWVADTLHHRVVRFAHAPSQPATGATADLVLGQSGFVSSTTFPPAAYTSGCSATKFNQPFGVHAGAGGRLYVADRGNHRVLVFQSPFGNGEAAVAVFGQAGFTACAANRGGAPSAATLNAPWNAYEDEAGDVYIADYGNNRVLVYRSPFAGGDFVADEVIGQPTLTSVALASSPGPDTLSSPAGIDADTAGRLIVADSENSRTLRYDGGVGVGGPLLDPLPSPVVAGGFLTVTGAGFTNGSVIKLFVATPSGVVAHGPYTPDTRTAGFLITNLPPTIPLGSGFVSVQVINTDQGFLASAAQSQWLFGNAAFGLPTITAVNGTGLPAPDPALPTAYIETSLAQGSTATITGTGFSSPLVNLFTAAGNLGPLTPLPGGTATQIRVVVPAGAPTGPGSFQVVNAPYTGTVTSNAVSVVIGARLSIGSVSQAGSTVTVNGTGFSVLTVVNLFNRQGGGAVNLGGLTPAGAARIPLAFVNATRVTFTVPAGAVSGPAFVEALNPPFVPYTSSGTDPDGAFALAAAPPAPPGVEGVVAQQAAAGGAATASPGASGASASAPAEGPASVQLSWMPHPLDARLVRAHESLAAAPGRLDLVVPERGDLLIGFGEGGDAARASRVAFGFEIRGPSRDLALHDNGETTPLGPVAPGEALSIRALATHVEFWRGDRLAGRSRGVPSFPLLVEAERGPAATAAGARLAGPAGRTVIWRALEAGDAPAGPPGYDRVRDGGGVQRGAAVLGELDGPTAIGLARPGEGACAVCVSRDGGEVQVWSDGRLRGRWPTGLRTVVALEMDTPRGYVRVLADGAWIDEVPLDRQAFVTLGLYEWRTGDAVGARRAVVSIDRQIGSSGGQK
jgi:sugar lactone lactonase YvrE